MTYVIIEVCDDETTINLITDNQAVARQRLFDVARQRLFDVARQRLFDVAGENGVLDGATLEHVMSGGVVGFRDKEGYQAELLTYQM